MEYDDRGNNWGIGMGSIPDGETWAEWEILRRDIRFDTEKWSRRYPELMRMSLKTEKVIYEDKVYEACTEALKPAGAVVRRNLFVGVIDAFGKISDSVKELGTVEENYDLSAGTEIGFGDDKDSLIRKYLGEEHFQASRSGVYEDSYRTYVHVTG